MDRALFPQHQYPVEHSGVLGFDAQQFRRFVDGDAAITVVELEEGEMVGAVGSKCARAKQIVGNP